MPDLRRVHRFRDHAVAGVNWRPTRFVDEVPSSRVCGLCRMIPKRIMVLPCGHLLCHSCLAANSEGCGGRCPLDQEPFEEAECVSYDLPTRKANALKVCCWNEAHGCQFEGAMEDMLRHYENECTFHTVECLRCGEEVLHIELSAHYVARCSVAVSSPREGNAPSDSQALTLEDVTVAFQNLKTLLREVNHEQLLPAIQSQMNEVIEQVRNQKSRSTVNAEAVAAPVTSEMAQVVAPSTTTSLQEGTSQQNPTEEASTSSTSRSCSEETLMPRQLEPLMARPPEDLQESRSADTTQAVSAPETSEMAQAARPSTSTSLQGGTSRQNPTEESSTSSSSLSCSAETLMRRQLKPFVVLPREVLQEMRKTSLQDYPQHAIIHMLEGVKCHLMLTTPLSTTVTWREVVGRVQYVLTLANFPRDSAHTLLNLACITVLHTSDAYFELMVGHEICGLPHLGVIITFHGMPDHSRCPPPKFAVRAYNLRTGELAPLRSYDNAYLSCLCHARSCAHHLHASQNENFFLVHPHILDAGIKFEIDLWQGHAGGTIVI